MVVIGINYIWGLYLHCTNDNLCHLVFHNFDLYFFLCFIDKKTYNYWNIERIGSKTKIDNWPFAKWLLLSRYDIGFYEHVWRHLLFRRWDSLILKEQKISFVILITNYNYSSSLQAASKSNCQLLTLAILVIEIYIWDFASTYIWRHIKLNFLYLRYILQELFIIQNEHCTVPAETVVQND